MQAVLKYPEHYTLKVGDYDFGRDGQLLTLPFYMLFFLTEVNCLVICIVRLNRYNQLIKTRIM